MSSENSPFLAPTTERSYRVVVEERSMYVYKDQLSAVSPVFERMISGDFVENKQGFITLKEKNFDDILELFGILFSASAVRKTITLENVEKMISFADEYDIEQLRVEIRVFLRSSLDRLKNGDKICINYANFAMQIGDCVDVVKLCIPFICRMPFNNTDLHKSILAAVYEAKYNRLSNNMHTFMVADNLVCNNCSTKGLDVYCTNCLFCNDCFHAKAMCSAGHMEDCIYRYRKDCKDSVCSCGYEFDETLLN